MIKRLFFLAVMVGVIGAPYLLSSGNQLWSSLAAPFTGSSDGKAATAAAHKPGQPSAAGDRSGAGLADPRAKPRPVEGFGAQDLGEVFHFDGTPAWVMTRWPRVTAGLAELDLQGYRVPLVTGTGADDLAGSLTYYFDQSQRVARISFHGTTGNPRKLVALVTSRYQFVPQQTTDPSLSLYQVRWNGKPQSELRIRTARVVRADQPNARYEVDLAMKRP